MLTSLNILDLIVFLLFTALSLYSLEAFKFQNIIKGSKVMQARVLYVILALSLSSLSFLYYLLLKLLVNGII